MTGDFESDGDGNEGNFAEVGMTKPKDIKSNYCNIYHLKHTYTITKNY
ncbi:MAG TPA: hypothetical protein VE244_07155 [Nitrososphaeraceae archaeon]|nr:hypothetical protein [Nitrososphaeraceae archaeon]